MKIREQTRAPAPLIAIGASAGGLEALEAFFASVPAVTGHAFVIIQDLSAEFAHLVQEVLIHGTGLPVDLIDDTTIVRPDRIYLIGAGRYVLLEHEHLIVRTVPVTAEGTDIVDRFMTSCAHERQRHSIGVILSGSGSDGAQGVRAIIEAGGRVLVQDPATAKFTSMPQRAIDVGADAHVLPAHEMARDLFGEAAIPPATEPQPRSSDGGGSVSRDRRDRRLAAAYELLIDRYVPPSLVINDRGEIVHSIGDAGQYLREPNGGIQTVSDIVLADVRASIGDALATALTTRREQVIKTGHLGAGHGEPGLVLRVQCLLSGGDPLSQVLVSFEPNTIGSTDPPGNKVRTWFASETAESSII